MADAIKKLVQEKETLQEKYDRENENNKALRHKAGQVFLDSLKNGASSKKASVKKDGGGTQFMLDDEDAIIRMNDEINLQRKGDLKARLMKITNDSSLISEKYFKMFILDQLHLEPNDLTKLNRVSKIDQLKRNGTMPIDILVQNIEDRIAKSEKMRDKVIKDLAK